MWAWYPWDALDPKELKLQMVMRGHAGEELNPGPLQEQPMLLNTKVSLQPSEILIFEH